MTSPTPTRTMMVVKRTLSKASFLAMRRSDPLADEPGEDLSPMGEVAELVEARAGRREHHHLAGAGALGCQVDGAVERRRDFVGGRSGERPFEVAGGLADQVEPGRLALDERRQRGQVGPLVAAAQDEM